MHDVQNHTPPPYSITDNSITILWNDESHTVSSSAPNYRDLKDCILNGAWDVIDEALTVSKSFEKISDGLITIKENAVHYNGEPIHNAATQKLLDLLTQGLSDPKPWMRFIEKLMANPSYNSREQSYKFLEHRNMPITKDGDVIGYKGVNNEYKDIYSGKFDNSVGQTLAMDRANVDDNVDHGCSAGFHIGSHDYADSWGSNGKLMVVEFSPTDIVSVPTCSSYAKLRVCRYKVIGESENRQKLDNGLYGDENDDRHEDIFDYLQKRWDKGKSPRFRKLHRKFPGVTEEEIRRATDEYGSDHQCAIEWHDSKNDYLVTLH
jgi:hypothetical protein